MSRGRFYLRCESDEWDFISGLSTSVPFDAAVISDRYLADYPDDHARQGEPRDRLITALEGRGVQWSVDPDTARLEQRKSAERQRPRAANRPVARALPLPLTVDALAQQEAVDALVEANTRHQLGSRALAAPYLEVVGPDDPRFAINLRLLARTRELAGDRAVIAYVQVLKRDLLNGGAAAVASRVAGTGADVVFVRVRRFEPEKATTDDVLAYAGVIDAGSNAGARVVPDCVGRLGPVLVATGGDGFASNAWRFRKLPDDLHPAGGGGGAGLLVWEQPGAPVGVVSAVGDASASCHVGDCPAPDGPTGDNVATRIHNLHEFQRLARLAAAEGLGYAARLASSPSPVVRGWAAALQELERRAA
jgi:hypothetical protein